MGSSNVTSADSTTPWQPRFADQFLDNFVPRAGRREVSLARLSGTLGVGSVTSSGELGGSSGRTRWAGGTPHVILADGLTAERRRWCWGHELAHVMLSRYDVYGPSVGRRLDSGGVAEEILCDDIARALLVPNDAFHGLGLDQLDAASRLFTVARQCQVPAVAAARRLSDVFDVEAPVVSLRQVGRIWSADVVVGAAFTSLRLDAGDSTRLLGEALDAARPFRLRLHARVDDVECVILLQGRPHCGEVWAEVKELFSRRIP